jgi:hypothetical protein
MRAAIAVISERGLRHLDSRFEARHNEAARMHFPRPEQKDIPLPHERVDVIFALILEVGGDDADDDVLVAVQSQFPPDGIRIGPEAPLPQAVADHRHVCGSGAVVLIEVAAQRRADAERAEELGGHYAAAQMLGLAAAGKVVVFPADGSHRRKAAIPVAPVLEVQVGDRHRGEIRVRSLS